MAQTSSISNTGTYFTVNGMFDEFTGAPVVDTSLQLWLDAGQTSSYPGTGSTWTDISNTGNNGTLNNSPTFDTAGFIRFNGSFQQVSFANTSSLRFEGTLPYTLSVWCNITADPGPSSWARIMDRDSDPGTGRSGYNFYVNQTGGTNLQIFSERNCPAGGGGSVGITIATSTFLNTWNHFVITYDSSNLIMYRNGVLVSGPSSSTGSIVNNVMTYSLFLYGGNRGFIGQNLIYNRALSATEVVQNYNAGCQRYGLAPVTTTQMPVIKRETSNAVILTNGSFDEFTGAPVVDTSLQLWLDAGQTSSYSGTGNTWTDLSVSGNALTLTNGPTFASTGGGGSIVFDGVDDYASGSVSPVFTGNAPHSIDLWFYLTSYSAGRSWILQLGPYTTGSEHWILYSATSTQFGVFAGAQLSPNIPLNTWINIITTFDGTTYTCYKNGVSVGSTAATFNFTGNILYLGLKLSGEFNMTGSIASCKLYSRALTGAEVVQNYNALSGRFGLAPVTTTQMPVVKRETSTGIILVNGVFDEFTGAASVVDGLIAYYDPAYPSSYSGSGANLYNLIDGVAATLNGTYSASMSAVGTSVSGNQTIRLSNSDLVTAPNNISHIQAPSYTNITTVCIWFYQHTYNGISRYILDGRSGGSGGWIYNGSIGTNWSTGIVYVNGGASSGTPAWANWGGEATGVWKNVTFIANTPFTDDINIFSRFSDNEGLDVTFGPILIYNRVLTQAENALNFNAMRGRFGI